MKKLYVGNLPFQATEEEISNWVKQAGATVATVSLVTDRDTGQPRGFGFVEINNDEEAARVIQALNGQDFMARNAVVNEARPREGGGGRGAAVLPLPVARILPPRIQAVFLAILRAAGPGCNNYSTPLRK